MHAKSPHLHVSTKKVETIQTALGPNDFLALDERTQALKDAMLTRLRQHEGRLSGRPFDTDCMAEVVALCLMALQDAGGLLGPLKERLRPDPRKVGGFDPLWGTKTYELVMDRGQPGIRCLRCNNVSFHPKDIENRFCGHCDEFHDG